MEWSAKFQSDIILLNIWPVRRIYVLNSLQIIRETMLSPESADALNGRMHHKFVDSISPGRREIEVSTTTNLVRIQWTTIKPLSNWQFSWDLRQNSSCPQFTATKLICLKLIAT